MRQKKILVITIMMTVLAGLLITTEVSAADSEPPEKRTGEMLRPD